MLPVTMPSHTHSRIKTKTYVVQKVTLPVTRAEDACGRTVNQGGMPTGRYRASELVTFSVFPSTSLANQQVNISSSTPCAKYRRECSGQLSGSQKICRILALQHDMEHDLKTSQSVSFSHCLSERIRENGFVTR